MLGNLLKQQDGEIYRMGIDGGGLTVTISHAFYDHLLGHLSRREDLEARFLEIRSGLYTDIVKFELGLPFISFPNRAHKKIDWHLLWMRAEQMNFLLKLLNFSEIHKVDDCARLYLSKNPQLMMISTGCSRISSFSACPIEVGFHQSAFDVLVKECKGDVVANQAEQRIVEFYSSMSCQSRKEKMSREKDYQRYGGSFTGTRAMVRAGGTPHFIVPGNCACLGANPDDFKLSFEMYSHNMDSPLQQFSMLVGLISFWNDFLLPKWQMQQKEALRT